MALELLLKETFKRATPAPIWRALHQWRHSETCYWTWLIASIAAGRYDNEVLNRFRIERRQELPPAIENEHLLCKALSYLPQGRKVEITDIGGGTGDMIRSARQRFANITATVVEHPGLVRLLAPQPGIRWATRPPRHCDVVFIGGTLQYLARPYNVLGKAFRSARVGVALARNSFCDRRLIRVQRTRLYDNGCGPIPPGFDDQVISYPHQTISEPRVLEMAEKLGFQLAFTAAETSGVMQYRDMVYGKQMLFLRSRT